MLFANHVAKKFGYQTQLIQEDLSKLIDLIEKYQIQQRQSEEPKPYQMSEEERQEALRFLKDEKLMRKVKEDIETLLRSGQGQNQLIIQLELYNLDINYLKQYRLKTHLLVRLEPKVLR
ncbi:MAG: hypothetical protein AB1567_12765 [bacterium]